MAEGYIHVLRDHGQDICDTCKLQGDEDIEGWENFLNGEWTEAPPVLEGEYFVVFEITNEGQQSRAVLEARKEEGKMVWYPSGSGAYLPSCYIKLRWSVPLPNPPQKKEV